MTLFLLHVRDTHIYTYTQSKRVVLRMCVIHTYIHSTQREGEQASRAASASASLSPPPPSGPRGAGPGTGRWRPAGAGRRRGDSESGPRASPVVVVVAVVVVVVGVFCADWCVRGCCYTQQSIDRPRALHASQPASHARAYLRVHQRDEGPDEEGVAEDGDEEEGVARHRGGPPEEPPQVPRVCVRWFVGLFVFRNARMDLGMYWVYMLFPTFD